MVAIAATLFFFHLGSYGLWEPDEARYAEIAREMLLSRNYLMPHLNYVLYLEKPPLLYWLTALCFKVIGQSEFAARIVPALSAMLGVIATYFFALRTFGHRRTILAGALLATAPLYAVMAQVLTTDMLLTALTTVALFAFFLALRRDSRWRWVFYAAMGLGVLAKGPVAIVVPVLAALVFLWWQAELAAIARLRPLSGFLLTIAIAAPWFAALSIREPDFVSFYFFGEHLRRFFEPAFSHGGPIYFYVPVLIGALIPWSIVTAAMPWRMSANAEARNFCLIAAATTFVLFSLASGKLIPYILPALPPLAVAIADAVVGCAEAATDRDTGLKYRLRLSLAAATLAILGGAALATALLAPRLESPYALAVLPALIGAGVIMLAGAALAAICLGAARAQLAVAVIVLTMAGGMLAASFARIEAEPLRSYAALSREVASKAPGATLICYHRYVQSLAFYATRRVVLVGSPSELRYGRDHAADSAGYFLSTDDDLMRLWSAPGTKVLVLDEPDLERLRPRLGGFVVIASESKKRAILRSNG